ncbi:MAG: ribosome maturation factor RimM, partial [Eubacterium sp.]
MNSIRQLNKQTDKGAAAQLPCGLFFYLYGGMASDFMGMNMEKILIGKITSAVGLKGEMKVYSYASSPQRFQSLERVWIDKDEYPLERSRTQKNMAVLKVSGIDDRDAAERMRGRSVFMSDEDLEELEEGAYYIRDLIGLDVVNEDTEEVIGKVKEILTDRPQDIYV